MKALRLSLKKVWFEMTKAGIKTEDYREINDYWCRRLLEFADRDEMELDLWQELIDDLNIPEVHHENANECMKCFGVGFKKFDTNIMTLGYPKSTDKNRILNLENKGIEIGLGNPEWGAEQGKLYFIIKHGKTITHNHERK